MTALERFNAMERFTLCIGQADAITLDDGPMLTSWDFFPVGDECAPEDIVLDLSWTDGENDFNASFLLGAIENGIFANNGIALVDSEGQASVLRFFRTVVINPQDVK